MTIPNVLAHLKIDDVIVAEGIKYLILAIHEKHFAVAWLHFPSQDIPFDDPVRILNLKDKIRTGHRHRDYGFAEWTFESILKQIKSAQVTFEYSISEYIL